MKTVRLSALAIAIIPLASLSIALGGCMAEVEAEDSVFVEDTYGEVEQSIAEGTPNPGIPLGEPEGGDEEAAQEALHLPFSPSAFEEPPPQPWEPDAPQTPGSDK